MHRMLQQYDPFVGHRFVPNLTAREDHESGGYLVRTNGAGFRCRHEFVSPKKDGTYRILLFGDSFTAGQGVRATDRYGDVLERILPGVEVFNFALGATGTDQQYLTFRHYAAHLEHDLIVVGVWVENILRNVSRYRTYFMPDRERTILAKPYFTFGDEGDLSLHHVPVPKHPVLPSDLSVYEGGTGSRLLRLRQAALDRLGDDAKYRLQRLARYQPLPQYDDAESPAWKLLRAILLRWGEEASVPLVVFPIPIHQYIEEMSSSTSCQARFRELHQPPKITVQDPLAEMRAFPLATRRSFRFPSDIHMTPVAHKVLAESLARAGPLRERVA